MNKIIIGNWNKVVTEGDLVYFLGDFCNRNYNPKYFLSRLNGNISFIKGNHDMALKKYKIHPLSDHMIIKHKDEKLMLVHTPEYLKCKFDGWVIHGHEHNHQPLLDIRNKYLNISCENINYTPIEIENLLNIR